jgi:hypothetical protein
VNISEIKIAFSPAGIWFKSAEAEGGPDADRAALIFTEAPGRAVFIFSLYLYPEVKG